MRKRIDKQWKFYPDGESPFFGVSNEGTDVNLPHDFSIIQKRNPNSKGGAFNAFSLGGMGCYKKSIFIPEDWKGKDIQLEFEGIYMNAEIHFNKQLVKRHIYGYTSFFADLTPYIQYGAENELSINVEICEKDFPEIPEVDIKLLKLAQNMNGMVITNDFNLNKVAEFQRVPVLNINELANAVKSVVLPGEEMSIDVIKDGKESGQGVAYLDDGTMIVIEGGRKHIGETLDVVVTSVLQTAAGRMIFAKQKE
jgi:hypothetical protein